MKKAPRRHKRTAKIYRRTNRGYKRTAKGRKVTAKSYKFTSKGSHSVPVPREHREGRFHEEVIGVSPERAAIIEDVFGKYAWVPTSSTEFIRRKQIEIERER